MVSSAWIVGRAECSSRRRGPVCSLALLILASTFSLSEAQDAQARRAELLALCQQRGKPTEERVTACSEVIAMAGADTDIRIDGLINRGLQLEALGRDREATVDYSTIIELDPGHALAHFNRANVLERLGDFDRALADYTRAIEIDATDPDFHHNRGALLAETGQHRQALADFDRAITLSGKDAAGWLARGAVREELGDFEGALADYRRSLEIDPRNEDARAAIARLEKRS